MGLASRLLNKTQILIAPPSPALAVEQIECNEQEVQASFSFFPPSFSPPVRVLDIFSHLPVLFFLLVRNLSLLLLYFIYYNSGSLGAQRNPPKRATG